MSAALPLDLPSPCRAFIRRNHPRLLLVARTDLWPEMLEQARLNQIPVVLFSYTQKAFRSPLKKIFTRWMFHWVERIYCVSSADKQHLDAIHIATPSAVMGDTRYDQVSYRLSHPKPIAEALRPSGAMPCLVAGSTWSEDEAVLLPALADALIQKRLKLILVPHEPTPEHLHKIEKQLAALGLSSALFSTGTAWNSAHVLLVDKMGYLAELYRWGTFAFVGGSFRKSVHSVMEALGAGLMTFVGPLHENNREALEFKAIPLGDFNGLEVVLSSAELRAKLDVALSSPAQVQKFSRDLQNEFKSREGASQRLVAALSALVRA